MQAKKKKLLKFTSVYSPEIKDNIFLNKNTWNKYLIFYPTIQP